MTNEPFCERCGNRTEDCECEPGFPYRVFCPISIYDPSNHNPDDCPYCNEPEPQCIQCLGRGTIFEGPGGTEVDCPSCGGNGVMQW